MSFVTPDEEKIRRFAVDIAFAVGLVLGVLVGLAWRMV